MPSPHGVGAQEIFVMTAILDEMSGALQRGDREAGVSLVRDGLGSGLPAARLLNEGLLPGMKIVGLKFRDYEIFLPDVLLSARAMGAAMDLLRPALVADDVPLAGRVVLGTIKGDLHDIGKNLVGIMLQGAGFEIVDLGVDVEPSAFIETALAREASLIGISALLTTTMARMKDVVRGIEDRGLRGRIRVVVGGAPVSMEFARAIGADGYAPDATSAVSCIRALVGAAP
jgi:5-methyltetrahydrofolate--homocysteine methyltransferase